jgi:hypothetical protein
MDLSRIEPKFLRENQLVGLGFPTQGYIFFRANSVETIEYDYTESPGSIDADTWVDSARLPMSAYSVDNVLRVTNCAHLYQVFMGWKPGCVRQYLYYPFETARRNLDVKAVYTKSPFGYLTGFDSPFSAPSPETELFIPKDIDVGFAWYNPSGETVDVEIKMIIRRIDIDIIRDSDLITRILNNQQPCRLVTEGGISSSMDYNAKSKLDVDFVKLGSSSDQIAQAVAESP